MKYPPEVLSTPEVRAILDCIRGPFLGPRNRALIAIMWRAQLRCAETLALQIKDTDLKNNILRILHGKGDRSRIVAIDDMGCELIQGWRDARARFGIDHFQDLFITKQGRPLATRYVRHMVKRAAARAQIPKRVHPHGFRHTGAYALAKAGVPLLYIQGQLGHANLSQTQHYINHLAPTERVDHIAGVQW